MPGHDKNGHLDADQIPKANRITGKSYKNCCVPRFSELNQCNGIKWKANAVLFNYYGIHRFNVWLLFLHIFFANDCIKNDLIHTILEKCLRYVRSKWKFVSIATEIWRLCGWRKICAVCYDNGRQYLVDMWKTDAWTLCSEFVLFF